MLQQFVWEEEEGGVSVMLRGKVKDVCVPAYTVGPYMACVWMPVPREWVCLCECACLYRLTKIDGICV